MLYIFGHLERSEGIAVRFRIRSALSIPWNNIHIAVGGIVTLSAMFTSGSRPISAKPSSPDAAVGPLDHARGSGR